MAGEWELRSVESLCAKVTTGGTPSRRRPDFFENGTIPWFKTGELQDRLLDDSEEHITAEALDSSSAKIFPKHTVLMAMYGDGDTITSLGVLMRPAATNQACCAMIVDPSICNWRYLFYALKHTRAELLRIVVGGAQRNLSGTLIRQHKLPVPSLREQQAIAHILGALDDKIELNRRMSETLEAMARALFRSWFVNFDPVRARAAGRDPGLPKHIADLFPTHFVDSECGEIPEGWGIERLDGIARFLNGLALQKYPPTGDEWLPVIKIAQLRSGTTEGADRATIDLPSDYIVNDGDILFSWSGSLECVVWAGGTGALNQHLFKVTSAKYPRWLCYFAIHQHLGEFRQIASGKATTMGHIQRHHLSDAKVVVPPKLMLDAMGEFVSPMFESLWKRHVESRTTGMVRDTLLPKLISGELRVKDADKFIGRVV